MKAIRADGHSIIHYIKFLKASAIPKDVLTEAQADIKVQKIETESRFDKTNKLTALREAIAERGYESEIEEVDKEFLSKHRGCRSDKAWEDMWNKACERYGTPDIPRDAL